MISNSDNLGYSNLKINKIIPPKKKSVLKKIAITGAIIGTVSITSFMGLVGVGVYNALKPYEPSSYATNNNFVDESTFDYDVSEKFDDPVVNEDVVDYVIPEYVQISNDVVVSLESEELDLFKSNLSSTTYYPYQELYMIEDSMNLYNPINKSVSYGDMLFDDYINVDDFYNSVKKNNVEYLNSLDSVSSTFYDEMSDEDIRFNCQIITDYLNDMMDSNSLIDKKMLSAKLADLKMLSKSGLANAFITNDDVLVVNKNCIEMAALINHLSVDVQYEATIKHEATHLVQDAIVEQNSDSVSYVGMSCLDDNALTNALYDSWFIEASAEKLMNDSMGINPTAYAYYINYLNTIEYSNIFNSNEPLANLTLYHDRNKLYELYSASCVNTQLEINKINYAIELMQVGDPKFSSLLSREGISISSDSPEGSANLTDFRYDIKGSFGISMTNVFYSNMCSFINDKDIPLNDLFTLIKVFEADINNHLLYVNSFYKDSYKPFMENYVSVQDGFFQLIADDLGMSVDEIKTMYISHSVTKGDLVNGNFDWLNDHQKSLINELVPLVENNKNMINYYVPVSVVNDSEYNSYTK